MVPYRPKSFATSSPSQKSTLCSDNTLVTRKVREGDTDNRLLLMFISPCAQASQDTLKTRLCQRIPSALLLLLLSCTSTRQDGKAFLSFSKQAKVTYSVLIFSHPDSLHSTERTKDRNPYPVQGRDSRHLLRH